MPNLSDDIILDEDSLDDYAYDEEVQLVEDDDDDDDDDETGGYWPANQPFPYVPGDPFW